MTLEVTSGGLLKLALPGAVGLCAQAGLLSQAQGPSQGPWWSVDVAGVP